MFSLEISGKICNKSELSIDRKEEILWVSVISI